MGNTALAAGTIVGGGGLNDLGSVTVAGSAAQAMEITGLALAKNTPLFLYWSIKNTGAQYNLRMYLNGNTTDANYEAVRLNIDGSTISINDTVSRPDIGILNANQPTTGFVRFSLGIDGLSQYFADLYRPTGGTTHNGGFMRGGDDTNVETTINAVRLDCLVAGGMAIGSNFTLKGY